jgi:hypothetical protein
MTGLSPMGQIKKNYHLSPIAINLLEKEKKLLRFKGTCNKNSPFLWSLICGALKL